MLKKENVSHWTKSLETIRELIGIYTIPFIDFFTCLINISEVAKRDDNFYLIRYVHTVRYCTSLSNCSQKKMIPSFPFEHPVICTRSSVCRSCDFYAITLSSVLKSDITTAHLKNNLKDARFWAENVFDVAAGRQVTGQPVSSPQTATPFGHPWQPMGSHYWQSSKGLCPGPMGKGDHWV